MKKPELLAPAGNMEKLRVAIHYGADAVYLAGKNYGLRNLADNFTVEELDEAVEYAHAHGVKVYLTINIYPNNADIAGIYRYLKDLDQIPFDAYIAADPGVVAMISEVSPARPIHLSTQANTTNWKSAEFWHKLGITRINVAREMPLQEIVEVKARVNVEVEAFVHGAMCISYSGRCLLSSVMTGRHANRGECAHPCRWSYALVEETRPGEYFPISEDENGAFIFNSKDLCLLPYLPELAGTGIDALKIEGRMKGIHYVASVVRIYRQAIDRYFENPATYLCRDEWLGELCKISHRGYTSGFLLGPPKDLDLELHSRYIRTHDFVGIVEEVLPDGSLLVGVRNRLQAGDSIEFIGPRMTAHTVVLQDMTSITGEPLQVARPNQRIVVRVPFPAEKYDLLRREKSPEQ